MTGETGKRLRIFTNETTKHQNMPLYEWILTKALNENLQGATVFRAIAGFGPHHHLHTTKLLSLSANLPLIIEIVDSAKNIENFLAIINTTLNNVFATVEDIELIIYHNKE